MREPPFLHHVASTNATLYVYAFLRGHGLLDLVAELSGNVEGQPVGDNGRGWFSHYFITVVITSSFACACRCARGVGLDIDRRLQVADGVDGGEAVDRRPAHRIAVGRPVRDLDDLWARGADMGQECGDNYPPRSLPGPWARRRWRTWAQGTASSAAAKAEHWAPMVAQRPGVTCRPVPLTTHIFPQRRRGVRGASIVATLVWYMCECEGWTAGGE